MADRLIPIPDRRTASSLDISPTYELFSKEALVERHPNLLTHSRTVETPG